MAPNVQNSLLLPEIAQHIASYCGYREQRDLAYTCRWLFSSVTPVIWKKVQGAGVLMKLIPGVKIEGSYHPSVNPGYDEFFDNIEFNESLLVEDWTRYWHYAPFVQYIEPCSPIRPTMRVSGWHFLLTKLQGRVLLPNLRSLDTKGLHLCSYFDRMAWFVVLLSPSLHKLNLADIWSGLDNNLQARCLPLLLGAILKSSSTNPTDILMTQGEWHPCPSEQTLASFFPNEYPEGSFWFGNMSAPTNLQDLKIRLSSWSTLWDELCIIGLLPLLESLEVVPFYSRVSSNKAGHKFKDAPLPSSVFPSLRIFALKGVIGASLFRWIWALKPMVSGLLSAYISLPNYGSNSKLLDANLGRLIHDNSPNLTVLTIDISLTSRVGALQIACELLSGVPVPALVIEDWISRKVGDYPATHSDSTFHHLRHLDVSATFHSPDWATLPKIAKAFPNLEYLCMNSSTESESYKPLDMSCISHTASQPIEIKLSVECNTYKETRDEEQWTNIRNDITNFLKAVWPNASITIDY